MHKKNLTQISQRQIMTNQSNFSLCQGSFVYQMSGNKWLWLQIFMKMQSKRSFQWLIFKCIFGGKKVVLDSVWYIVPDE